MDFLKQSTAVTVKIGPFLDDTDGKTAEKSLTLSRGDIRLSKNGGDMAQKHDANACTHDEIGYYDCALDDTDTGTLGRLKLMVHKSGALPVWHEYTVLAANVYDALIAASDKLLVDVAEISGDSTAADNAELMFDGTGYAGGTTKLNVNVAAQDNIDFGATQKTSLETAVENKLTAANTELAAIPSTTGSLRAMIQFLHAYFRNKRIETASEELVMKEDASTTLGTRTLADDGTTFTRGEMG